MSKTRIIKERKEDFVKAIKQALVGRDEKYNNPTFLNKFYNYWTEHADNPKPNTKMRFEMKRFQPFNTWARMVRFFHNYGEEQWTKKVEMKQGTYVPPKRDPDRYLGPEPDYEKAKQRAALEEAKNNPHGNTLGRRMQKRWNSGN